MNSQRDVMTDGELTALLRSVDPWALEFGVDDCMIENDVQALASAVLTDGATVIPIESSRALSRRRTRVALAAGAGAVALALAGVGAVASGLLGDAWTGTFAHGTPDGRVVVNGTVYENADGTDTSQLIDSSAGDFLDVVASLAPREFALPRWVTWDQIVDHQRAVLASETEPGVASANYYRTGFIFLADTAWKVEWVEATETGDPERAASALKQWRVALDANRWAWTPQQVEVPYDLLAAAGRGDVTAVRYDLEVNGPTWLISRIGLTYRYDGRLPLSNGDGS